VWGLVKRESEDLDGQGWRSLDVVGEKEEDVKKKKDLTTFTIPRRPGIL
jgi:hypothetical protein